MSGVGLHKGIGLRVVSCGALLAVAANACAADRPAGLDWLKIAAFAGHQTDYSGVFVYQYDNHVETSKIIHIARPNGEFEKLDSLDGPQREVIRHDGAVWSYVNHKMVQLDNQEGRSRFPSLLPEQLATLSENYQAKLLGVERIAGYNAQAIQFIPQDNLRYSHKIWVHTDSGLLLKAAVLSDRNQITEQYSFTQLQIGGKIDTSWVKECDDEEDMRRKTVQQMQGEQKDVEPVNSGWVADTVPAGFRKTMEVRRMMHGKHAPVTQIVYSDGLSAISVFIEQDDGDDDDVEGLASRGAMSLYHKVMGKNLITVVGEVPPRTVMQVLDSVRYNGR